MGYCETCAAEETCNSATSTEMWFITSQKKHTFILFFHKHYSQVVRSVYLSKTYLNLQQKNEHYIYTEKYSVGNIMRQAEKSFEEGGIQKSVKQTYKNEKKCKQHRK